MGAVLSITESARTRLCGSSLGTCFEHQANPQKVKPTFYLPDASWVAVCHMRGRKKGYLNLGLTPSRDSMSHTRRCILHTRRHVG